MEVEEALPMYVAVADNRIHCGYTNTNAVVVQEDGEQSGRNVKRNYFDRQKRRR